MGAFLYFFGDFFTESCQHLTADAVSIAKFPVFAARLALDSVFCVCHLISLQIALRVAYIKCRFGK